MIEKIKRYLKIKLFDYNDRKDKLELSLQKLGVEHVFTDNANYLFEYEKLTFYIRNRSHSDYKVFVQIFKHKEYEIIVNLLTQNGFIKDEFIMLDVGANIGLTSMYFARIFNNHQIYCVEPSGENINILKKNVELNKFNFGIYQKAICERSGLKFDISNNFRDNKDWSLTTSESDTGEIEGITINEIINQNKLSFITFLKIDVEGAERFIFEENVDLSYLRITKIISVEIHDEYDIRETICNLLIFNNFIIFNIGELTIGINKNHLK